MHIEVVTHSQSSVMNNTARFMLYGIVSILSFNCSPEKKNKQSGFKHKTVNSAREFDSTGLEILNEKVHYKVQDTSRNLPKLVDFVAEIVTDSLVEHQLLSSHIDGTTFNVWYDCCTRYKRIKNRIIVKKYANLDSPILNIGYIEVNEDTIFLREFEGIWFEPKCSYKSQTKCRTLVETYLIEVDKEKSYIIR